MTSSDHEFCQRCDQLFASLSSGYMNKVAVYLGWSLDDLKQEWRLLCWEVESGLAGFDAAKGDLPGYFIGRLQKKLHRSLFLNFALSVDGDEKRDDARSLEINKHAASPSVLEQMVDDEAQRAAQAEDDFHHLPISLNHHASDHSPKPSWILKLWQQGLTQSQIASVGGVSQSSVSRYLSGKSVARKPSPT